MTNKTLRDLEKQAGGFKGVLGKTIYNPTNPEKRYYIMVAVYGQDFKIIALSGLEKNQMENTSKPFDWSTREEVKQNLDYFLLEDLEKTSENS